MASDAANSQHAAIMRVPYHSSPRVQILDPVHAGVKSCWEKATENYNARSRDEKRKIKNYAPQEEGGGSLTELVDAFVAAKTKSRASESSLRKKTDDGIDRLQHYAPAIDVLIQQHPDITALVWSPIRLLLRVGTRRSGLDAEVENGMVLIISNMGTWLQHVKNEPTVRTILEICSHLFSHIITFLVEARIYYEKSGTGQLFNAGFSCVPEIITGAVQSILRFSDDLSHAAQAAADSKAIQFRSVTLQFHDSQVAENSSQSQFRDESRNAYQSLADSFRESARQTKLHHEEEIRHKKVERAIRMLSPPQEVPNNIPERAQNTCEWILNHEVFRQWMQSPCRKLLWIHGCPGSGKSVMASYLRDTFTIVAQPTFIHFFSLNTDKVSTDKRSFALSIVIQILKKGIDSTQSGFLGVVDKIASLCLGFDNRNQVSWLTLRPLICEAFKELHQYTLIVDGLDECENFGEPVIKLTEELVAGSPEPRPKIIVLSRKSDALAKLCSNAASVAMSEGAIMPDVERFIAEMVCQNQILKPIHKKILEKARECCHGNFLWASTMMGFLLKPANHVEARLKRLQSIPDSLIKFYEQLLNRASEGKEDWELKLRREIFLLLLNPKRALTVDEVGIALQFDNRRRQPVKRRLESIRDTIYHLCWPLVSITDGRVVLVHTLVEDFLTQTVRSDIERNLSVHITRTESDATLASRCLNVLSEDCNRDPNRISYWLHKDVYYESLLATAVPKQVFYEYAARYWNYHLTSVSNPGNDLLDSAANFLHNFEFVMYGEYLYNLKFGEIGPISEVKADLESWRTVLPPESKERLVLDDFYEDPYRKLSQEYARNDGSKVLQYLCLFRLGDFYTLQANIELWYQTFKEVADGLEAILGSEEPLVLRSKYMWAASFLPRRELPEALELCTKISELQKTICGLEKTDYWKTLQLKADVQFLMTDFDEATITEAKVSKGWTGVTNVKRFNVQVSDISSGNIFEARGLLEDALIKYTLVEETQRKALGDENPVTLYAQACMASAFRKQGNEAEARKYLEHVLAARLLLFGEKNQLVVDTTIQLIIVDRESEKPGSNGVALGRIDWLMGNGGLEDMDERYCQVRHLQALILLDEGGFEEPRKILQSLLDDQAQKGRDANNRSLLWVRLTLATILREHEKEDEVALLFEDIITANVRGDVSPQFDRLDTPEELKIAEQALRHVRSRQLREAEQLLQENDLRWVRQADFWLLEGCPSVDTAWMKGP